MNKLTRKITRQMYPEAALIVYGTEENYSLKEYYLEFRGIGKNGLMGAGKPVSLQFVQSLTENFSVQSQSVPHGIIPKGMLYSDTREEKYIWHRPPCRKYMYFKTNLNISNGTYAIPGLVWIVERNSLYLFAYTTKRLSVKSRLYSAPFFNVNPNSGSVCLGNAKLKLPENISFEKFIKYWEDKFFLSEFSHISGTNPTKRNLVLVLKNATDVFDHQELIPVKKLKLKDLLK